MRRGRGGAGIDPPGSKDFQQPPSRLLSASTVILGQIRNFSPSGKGHLSCSKHSSGKTLPWLPHFPRWMGEWNSLGKLFGTPATDSLKTECCASLTGRKRGNLWKTGPEVLPTSAFLHPGVPKQFLKQQPGKLSKKPLDVRRS